jgi:transcriptional regulator with XRE-family HTH domain
VIEEELETSRRRLGANLRSLRHNAKLSGRELAQRAGMSQSKISKLECAKLLPTREDLESIAVALRLDASTKADLLAHERRLHEQWTSTREVVELQRERQQLALEELERSASTVEVFTMTSFPSLLQTADYGEAVLRAARVWYSPDVLDDWLVLRMRRQSILFDLDRRFRFLVLESAFETVYGSASILQTQIDSLEAFVKRPNIELRVVRRGATQRRCATSNFSCLDREVAAVETPTGDFYLKDPEVVSVYASIFDDMWNDATEFTNVTSVASIDLRETQAC